MEIKGSAYRHGYDDPDIFHAIRNRIITHDMDGYLMVVGPTHSGELIEVGINQDDEVFHVDRARSKYLTRRKK